MIVNVEVKDSFSEKECTDRTIILRKFFQMVFVGTDKSSLHIYTALVAGSAPKDKCKEDSILVSDISRNNFRLNINFSVNKTDNNFIEKIYSEDITTSNDQNSRGFIDQIDCIKRVWGSKCSIIHENKSALKDKLKSICGTDQSGDLDDLVGKKLLWIEHDKREKKENDSLKSLCIPAQVEMIKGSVTKDNKNCEIEASTSYTITKPDGIKLYKGIELVSWVRTTIKFTNKLCDKNINFILKNVDVGNVEYISPDFTWYFSPTPGSIIDNKNSILEVKRKSNQKNYNCSLIEDDPKCPLKDEIFNLRSEKLQNGITSVPNLLTVDFEQWTQDEKIKQRQKYRISSKDFLPNQHSLSEISEINIYIDTSDEHARGNRQFLVGIIISFLLAFGLDSARLQEFGNFLFLKELLPEDICWVIYITLLSLTLLMRPSYIQDDYRKAIERRKVCIIVSFFWIACALLFFRLPFCNIDYSKVIIFCKFSVSNLLQFICCIAIYLNINYLYKYHLSTFKNLVADIFGEEIL